MLSLLAILAGTIGAGAVYGGEYAVYTKISAKRAEKKAVKTSPAGSTTMPQDSILATASPEEISFAAKAIGCQDTADLMTAAADGRLQAAIQNLRMAAQQLQSEPEDDDLFCEEVWEEDPVYDPTPEQAPEEEVPPAEQIPEEVDPTPEEEKKPRDKNGKFIKKGNK